MVRGWCRGCYGGCRAFGIGAALTFGGFGASEGLRMVVEASGIWAWSLRITACTLELRDWSWNSGIGAVEVWVCGPVLFDCNACMHGVRPRIDAFVNEP